MKKIVRMIFAAAFAGIICFNAYAQSLYNVQVENRPLSMVLAAITAQCEYKFVYNNDFIDVSRNVTVSASSDSFSELLDAVFTPLGIRYTLSGRQIALSVPEPEPEKKGDVKKNVRTVTGTVTDRTGDPLAGAVVYVDGTSTGAYCDMYGRYTIEVPDKPTTELTFDFVGMKQGRAVIGTRTVVDMVLEDTIRMLEQSVVTGYQTISRERSAGAFARVGGAEVKDQANVHGNILRALEGSVAGLSVSESADGVRYLIRGVSSINSSTEPLFIVDGIAMTRQQMEKMVNPNDVESVNFLKDATAASIWGAQAANGVIVITTKTGKSSEKLTVGYNGSFTWKGKPNYSYMDMMTSADFVKSSAEVFDPQTYKWKDINNTLYGVAGGNYPVVYPHEDAMYKYYLGEISLDQRDAILSRLATADGRKEYEKYFMSNSYITNHSVSFSGGNEKGSFYSSIEYQREQGAYTDPADDYKFYFRDVFKFAKWATLDVSLSAYYTKTKSHSATSLLSLPYITYFDENGAELSLTDYIMTSASRKKVEDITGISLAYNGVSDYKNNVTESKTMGANANAGLTIKFTPWLNYEGRFQYSLTKGGAEAFIPADSYFVREERSQGTDINGVQYLPTSGGHFTISDEASSSYTIRNQLNINLSVGENNNHNFTALAGFEMRDRLSGSHSSFMRGYDKQTMQHIPYNDYLLSTEGVYRPALPSFFSATSNFFDPNQYTQTEIDYRFVSVYANGAYTLMDKYSLNASIRVDQSNLFGSDPSVQFKPIWSVGAIWNAAKERFMQATWLDRFNVRASFGYAGNSPNPGEGGPYDILSSVTDPNYSKFGLGYVISTPSNDKLTWEKTRTINVGVDWAVLENRLGGSIDFYDKNTTNLLAQTPCDPSSGFTTVLSNVGRMVNRGAEFTLNAITLRKGDFEWNTDFNFTYNFNKLVDMYVEPPTTPYLMVDYNYWEGYPYGTIFAYKWAGLDPADGMPRAYDSQGNIVRTLTNIDSDEAVHYKGSTIPPFFGSLGNDFRWGAFDLNIQFIYNLGHVLRNDTNGTYSYRLGSNLHNDFSKRWKTPGDEQKTDIPAYYSLKNTSINELDVLYLYRYADINVLDASYIKLRELSVGYSLPRRACSAIHANSASVRLIANNLATIAFNGEGIDPECFSLSGGSRSDKFGPFLSASLNIEF